MLKGIVYLNGSVLCIPKTGIEQKKIRVELIDTDNSEDAWMSELTIEGNLPWYVGDKRNVTIRVMNEDFLKSITVQGKQLDVRRGEESIGYLSVMID